MDRQIYIEINTLTTKALTHYAGHWVFLQKVLLININVTCYICAGHWFKADFQRCTHFIENWLGEVLIYLRKKNVIWIKTT